MAAIALLILIGNPALLVWGWVRWARNRDVSDITATLSLVGFCLATVSALLAVSTGLYAMFVRSFPFYDPTLMKIYGWGCLLSLGGILLGLGGIWRKGPLRWHAFACSLGMLLFWFMEMSTE